MVIFDTGETPDSVLDYGQTVRQLLGIPMPGSVSPRIESAENKM